MRANERLIGRIAAHAAVMDRSTLDGARSTATLPVRARLPASVIHGNGSWHLA